MVQLLNMSFKNLTAFLLFNALAAVSFSQKVIYESESVDYGDKKFGQNRSWFMHTFLNVNYQYPLESYDDFASDYASSFGFGFGLRVKKRIVKRAAVIFDARFDWLNYAVEPTNNYEGKFSNISTEKWLNKIQYRSFNFDPMLGVRYNFYRGNSVGPYVDLGAIFPIILSERRNLVGGDHHDSKDKQAQKDYTSEVVSPIGVYFRIGGNSSDLTISYLPNPNYDAQIGIYNPSLMFTYTISTF